MHACTTHLHDSLARMHLDLGHAPNPTGTAGGDDARSRVARMYVCGYEPRVNPAVDASLLFPMQVVMIHAAESVTEFLGGDRGKPSINFAKYRPLCRYFI